LRRAQQHVKALWGLVSAVVEARLRRAQAKALALWAVEAGAGAVVAAQASVLREEQ